MQILREQLHQAPQNFGILNSRWTLATLQKRCAWLRGYSLSGIWQVMRALHLHYKRGQQHIHSPDPDYVLKRDRIADCIQQARAIPQQVVALYLDEFSYYRWPSVAKVYADAGTEQPKAKLTPSYNTRGRFVAALEIKFGKLFYLQRSHITVQVLVQLLELIRQAYPEVRSIYIIQDNWHNVHFNPAQVAAADRLGIDLVPLPTYAPWLNPIEKLGRKLRQEVTHMHTLAQDWDGLKQFVADFLNQFSAGSDELLRYTGLLPG